LEIREKPGVFRFSYQLHSSLADCAKELFKPSKDSASLQVCNEKKFLALGFIFFGSDVVSERFLAIFGGWYLTWAQPLDGSISLKFLCWKLG